MCGNGFTANRSKSHLITTLTSVKPEPEAADKNPALSIGNRVAEECEWIRAMASPMHRRGENRFRTEKAARGLVRHGRLTKISLRRKLRPCLAKHGKTGPVADSNYYPCSVAPLTTRVAISTSNDSVLARTHRVR